jgi:hypothetical protein
MTVEDRIDLRCHPSAPSAHVRALSVLVFRSAGAELRTAFRLEGDLGRIRVPAARPARSAANLWRHTCFEVFMAIEGQPAYHEFNFAPSGEWTVYAFSGYRAGGPLADETMHPRIDVRSAGGRLELDARIRLDTLSAMHRRAPLRIGLAAVIEADNGRLSYWALRHQGDKPDFHDAGGFALLLGPPDS